jgi:hypothetical protein
VSRRSQIYLGDLLYALRALGTANPETIRLIAEMLGFVVRNAPSATVGTGRRRYAPPPRLSRPKPVQDATSPEPSEHEVESQPLPSIMTALGRLDPGTGDDAAWLAAVEPLQPPGDGSLARYPPPQPLLLPRWTRNIVAAALATAASSAAIDVEHAVTRLASGQPIIRLPARTRRGLQRGVQLLLDMGDGMTPFALDRETLAHDIVRTLGGPGVRILRFAGSPLRGAGQAGEETWGAFQLPAAGTPVCLVTDLGIGRPPTSEPTDVEEWLEFVALARSRDCPIVAFVPYCRQRVPKRLAGAMHIVVWDRGTSAAEARRDVR